jgi:hypothetical protein
MGSWIGSNLLRADLLYPVVAGPKHLGDGIVAQVRVLLQGCGDQFPPEVATEVLKA